MIGILITITNNADGRILTATGSSTSIDGETGLTYNGSTLAVTGAITATGDITAYSSDQSESVVSRRGTAPKSKVCSCS